MSNGIQSHFFPDTRTEPYTFIGTLFKGDPGNPLTLAVGREHSQAAIEEWISLNLMLTKIHPMLTAPDAGKREVLAAQDK